MVSGAAWWPRRRMAAFERASAEPASADGDGEFLARVDEGSGDPVGFLDLGDRGAVSTRDGGEGVAFFHRVADRRRLRLGLGFRLGLGCRFRSDLDDFRLLGGRDRGDIGRRNVFVRAFPLFREFLFLLFRALAVTGAAPFGGVVGPCFDVVSVRIERSCAERIVVVVGTAV